MRFCNSCRRIRASLMQNSSAWLDSAEFLIKLGMGFKRYLTWGTARPSAEHLGIWHLGIWPGTVRPKGLKMPIKLKFDQRTDGLTDQISGVENSPQFLMAWLCWSVAWFQSPLMKVNAHLDALALVWGKTITMPQNVTLKVDHDTFFFSLCVFISVL